MTKKRHKALEVLYSSAQQQNPTFTKATTYQTKFLEQRAGRFHLASQQVPPGMGSQFLVRLVKPFHQRSQAPANPIFDQTATLFPSLRLLMGGKQAFLVFIPHAPYLNTWEAGRGRGSSSSRLNLLAALGLQTSLAE